jgi:hypothetical protein
LIGTRNATQKGGSSPEATNDGGDDKYSCDE